MAEGRSVTARQHGRGGPLERGRGRAADGVDAGINAVQEAGLDPPMYRRVVQTERQQLRPGDIPMLPACDLGDFFRQTKVISHNP